MIIVADSGSTKTDWCLIDENGKQTSFHSSGLNPFLVSKDAIKDTLEVTFKNAIKREGILQIYFYGAGCSDDFRCSIIQHALSSSFPKASIDVQTDLLGSARACCGHSAGIACILGTGSHACLYDGRQISDSLTSLGYLVGDEGSGNHLGKKLLRAHFYRALPNELEAAFIQTFPDGKRAIMNKLYKGEKTNAYLASFTRFLSTHIHHPFIHALVKESFTEFVEALVCKYEGYKRVPIHFVGSVAFHFQKQLKEVLKEQQLQFGTVVQKPIMRLAEYHTTELS